MDLVYLTQPEARAMIDRGIAKARELRQVGAIVIVDANGTVISISRMDDSPIAAVHVSRAKAYLAAVQGRPTANLAANAHERPEIFAAYQAILPQQPFPGAGGMPIFKHGRVVGGIATGAGIAPYTEIAGVDPGALIVDGQPANAEDLVISAALGVPYQNQHGPLALRSPGASVGTVPLPLDLTMARRYADRAMQKAAELGGPIGVAVVDELGRLIQADAMDGAAMGSAVMAEAKAMTALKFRRPTAETTEEFRSHSARIEAIEKLLGFTILAMAGGIPIAVDGRIVGSIGVSGSGAQVSAANPRRYNDADIAMHALAAD